MITNGVGSVLRQIRKSRGESIVEVAKATHTSPASFTKWENDQTIPSERSIRKLAEYYQTDPLELLGVAYPDKYAKPVSYTHLRAHETVLDLVCRLLLEKKKKKKKEKKKKKK
ncbi:transcriptional regulator [Lactobacillus casei subsp. casei ATCC 393] [Lacticaseibacillus rhamnosus]|nr:transcriptional regulator [Lactobacillus casei subsp. casei ATCC 393] [Lacticaseibacillus rhamnosus]